VLAILTKLGRHDEALRFAAEKERQIMEKMIDKAPLTSGFGRILDALSAYLGICDTMTYDGEPAMRLEKYLSQGKRAYDFEIEVEKKDRAIIRTLPLFEQLIDAAGTLSEKTLSEKKKADLAHSFVAALVDEFVAVAAAECERTGITAIGITGGVSYDVPIVEMARDAATKRGLKLLTHDKLPNGDGGISVGQNLIAGHTGKNQRQKNQ
jgi:hydrogenase maturation protein HypF